MIGCFLLGIGGALLAAKLFHLRRHHHLHGCGWRRGGPGRWHGGPDDDWDDDHDPWERGRWTGGGFWARLLSRRLDATPAQEKVMREAVAELRGFRARGREEVERTRADVAAAFRKSSLDEVMLGELFARHDVVLEDLRKAFVGAAAKIHATLDDEQRARLADMVESGRGHHRYWPSGERGRWRRRRPHNDTNPSSAPD